jgi:hypothetical protein
MKGGRGGPANICYDCIEACHRFLHAPPEERRGVSAWIEIKPGVGRPAPEIKVPSELVQVITSPTASAIGASPDNRALVPLVLELWSAHAVLHFAVLGFPPFAVPPIESTPRTFQRHPPGMGPFHPSLNIAWEIRDDAGSEYVATDGSLAGGGGLFIGSQTFRPPPPPQASTLTFYARSTVGAAIGAVSFPLGQQPT